MSALSREIAIATVSLVTGAVVGYVLTRSQSGYFVFSKLPVTGAQFSHNSSCSEYPGGVKLRRAFLDTEDGQVLYRYAGEGTKPALVLIHMNPRSSDEWVEQIPIYAQYFRVFALDLMGFGESDKPVRLLTVSDYARHVIALLDAHGIPKASIVGNHTGAFVSCEIAAAFPERVERIILCNVAYFGSQGKADLQRRYSEGWHITGNGSMLWERWQARSRYVGSAELNLRWVLDDLRCHNYPLWACYAVGEYWDAFLSQASKIRAPTLLLWGYDDVKEFERLRLAKAKDTTLVERAIPHAEVHYMQGTLCMMNQLPKEVSERVVGFLRRTNV